MSRRNSPNILHTSDSTISFASSTTISSLPQDDIYDKFIELYFNSNIKQRFALIANINNSIRHSAYIYILKTMNTNNIHHIIGYFRSQLSAELYNAFEHTISLSNNSTNTII